jgi:hypothetical protein
MASQIPISSQALDKIIKSRDSLLENHGAKMPVLKTLEALITRRAALICAFILVSAGLLFSQNIASAQEVEQIETFTESKVIIEAAKFLGTSAENMAEIVGRIFAEYGPPSAIIKGEEVSAAIMIGLRYGRGELQMQDGRSRPIYWRGPSAGIDTGGNAAKSFALVYGLTEADEIYKRFVGVEGSAFYLGGVSVNFLERDNVIVVPMRAGVGMRLGANIGYVKFTPDSGWLPF